MSKILHYNLLCVEFIVLLATTFYDPLVLQLISLSVASSNIVPLYGVISVVRIIPAVNVHRTPVCVQPVLIWWVITFELSLIPNLWYLFQFRINMRPVGIKPKFLDAVLVFQLRKGLID